MKLNAVLLIVLEVDDLESLLTKRVRPLTGVSSSSVKPF